MWCIRCDLQKTINLSGVCALCLEQPHWRYEPMASVEVARKQREELK